jgi:hypothetical protein
MSVRGLAMVAFLGLTVGTAAACSSSAPPQSASAASRPSANAASTAECAKVPSDQVGKALGLSVGKVTAVTEGPVTVCSYAGKYAVVVRYQTGESASLFAQARQNQASLHESVGTVTGLGDSAYFASYAASKPVTNTLGVLQGGTAVFITSPASSAAESTLMTELLKNV